MVAHWSCQVCGYIYNPEQHENSAFEDLSSNWQCPICGVGKDHFVEI
jgi:N-acyl homoserine lactone hydrolase